MKAEDVVQIALEHNAMMTAMSYIRWVYLHGEEGMWVLNQGQRPSVLDAVILDQASTIGPRYIDAAVHALKMSHRGVVSFQKMMLLGEPIGQSPELENEVAAWRGTILGFQIYDKLRQYKLGKGEI